MINRRTACQQGHRRSRSAEIIKAAQKRVGVVETSRSGELAARIGAEIISIVD